ncbi:gamma-glutamyl-gamma-aminobutyrate hydrolase family protein [Flexivirga caeni]|uniref:gamma-glutamyl-gamma-aminobutyrate hydrolase family protein n=1 Tax=Flexivirga caeni TaxID=2294115 RepID=UPI0013150FFE|nr:gamma-glutamyl-gamma-aminobutyrate hydrolase family protein [Flexivirga caeni]
MFGPPIRDMYGAEVQYVHAVQRAGARVLLSPQASVGTDPREVIQGMTGLVLIGGEDLAAPVSGVCPHTVGENASESLDRWDIALLRAALSAELPVLAICRGLQLLNAACGGTLHGDIAGRSPEHPPVAADPELAETHRHGVTFTPGSLLATVYGLSGKEVNSLHHQAIDRLGDGLDIAARASDGGIEAIELVDARWCVGVQWHPELLPEDDREQALFRSFVSACAEPGHATHPTARTNLERDYRKFGVSGP